jgi:DNA-binding XRE family transcriptional regulator
LQVRVLSPPPIRKRGCWLALCEGSPADFRRKIEFFVFVLRSKAVRNRLFIILFSLLDLKLFGIIILKDSISLTYYQIIEIMARENNIGENIKKYRTKQGLSQEDFAKKSGVKYTTLTKIESGVIKKPSVLVMAKIAKALGVNIEELIK